MVYRLATGGGSDKVRFISDHHASTFEGLHPAIRAVAVELEHYVGGDLMITGTIRTAAKMAEIYGANWKARGKFSWHLVGRAVDIRNRDWSPERRVLITAWLKANWPDAEILMHDIGRGDHLHLAIPEPRSRLRRLRRWVTRRSKGA